METADRLIRTCTKRRFSLSPFLKISKIMKSVPDDEKDEYASHLLMLLEKSRSEEEFMEILESSGYSTV